jgi:tRNA pseudouridine55 synthase
VITAGVLNMLKPPGMTSFSLTSFASRCLKGIKTGHTGTLDPAASGVLPVCIGKATSLASWWMAGEKIYRAEMTVGITTDTQDATGKVLHVAPLSEAVTDETIKKTLMAMTGPLMQIPPMYSAVRTGGRRLYELARQGEEVTRQPRPIRIADIRLLSISGSRVLFDVRCSSGTYIRTLCADIGETLGCGACLSCLIRLASGPFRIEEAVTVEQLEALSRENREEEAVIPVDRMMPGCPAITIPAGDRERFLQGGPVQVSDMTNEGSGFLVYDERGSLLGFTADIRRDPGGGNAMIGKRNPLA